MNKKIIVIIIAVVIIAIIVAICLLPKKIEPENEIITTENIIEEKIIYNNTVSTNQVIIKVYDKDNKEIYNRVINTNDKKILDVINKTNLKLITEDSESGQRIVAINDIKQENDYYWTLYINDEKSENNIAECEVEDGKTYSFRLEN